MLSINDIFPLVLQKKRHIFLFVRRLIRNLIYYYYTLKYLKKSDQIHFCRISLSHLHFGIEKILELFKIIFFEGNLYFWYPQIPNNGCLQNFCIQCMSMHYSAEYAKASNETCIKLV